MNAYVVSFWGEETNPYANPATCCNGGGYSQPAGGMLVETETGEYLAVEVSDSSCGDFGDRIDWRITLPDGRVYGGCYGTMSDASIDNAWSDESMDSIDSMFGWRTWYMIQDALEAVHFAASMS